MGRQMTKIPKILLASMTKRKFYIQSLTTYLGIGREIKKLVSLKVLLASTM